MGPAGDASNPGPGLDACRWFHRNDVAAVADDVMTFEVFPGPEPENMLGVHCLAIVDMGLTTGQIWDLEALSAACADEGRYHFFLSRERPSRSSVRLWRTREPGRGFLIETLAVPIGADFVREEPMSTLIERLSEHRALLRAHVRRRSRRSRRT